ncbi:MAG TPA: 3-methyl-2-oxobutanoate dehydrogenase subunit VorB [Terriglobales bacterium]|nr:3-methyl-2-oxobutanoate dehydrogenase subunit VorB [Terriglobales bacterium]
MERIFMKGSEAIAESAVRAGCRFFAGYPITPQNEIPEYFSRRLPEVGGVFVQGESEIASVNMIYGAASGGVRAMTSSSSCGIALKSEGISYLAAARFPCVICSVMRGGPGCGEIKPAQQDYFQATKASGNGGFRTLVYAPSTVQEAVDLMGLSFEKAEQYRYPVILLVDGFIAVMMEPVSLPAMLTDERLAEIRENADKWALGGRKPGEGTRMLGWEADKSLMEQNIREAAMYEGWKKTETMVEEYLTEDAKLIITAYGTSARIARSAVEVLRAEGRKVGLIRPVALYPFAGEPWEKLNYEKLKGILVAEMSIPALYVEDVQAAVARRCGNIRTVLSSGGVILTRDQVLKAAREMLQ